MYRCIFYKKNCGIWLCGVFDISSWWRHQIETISALLAFVRGIHRSPVNSPHKGQWRGSLMFTLICAQINGWVNNGEAGDLGRNRTHYDVIVMISTVNAPHRIPMPTTVPTLTQGACDGLGHFKRLRLPAKLIWLVSVTNLLFSNTGDLLTQCYSVAVSMMTSAYGNIFRATGHLWGEFTGHRWIPRTKASDAELWCFLWSAPEWTVE